METNNVNSNSMVEKIDRAFNKIEKGIAVPMLLITALSSMMDFTSGKFGWGTTMLLCSAWWAYVVYQYFIDRQD